jgi:hypothetical protein
MMDDHQKNLQTEGASNCQTVKKRRCIFFVMGGKLSQTTQRHDLKGPHLRDIFLQDKSIENTKP